MFLKIIYREGVSINNWILKRKQRKRYENLNMGHINSYSIIINKNNLGEWLEKGWIEAPKFRNYHYEAKKGETVILSKPDSLTDRGLDYLIGKKIKKHTCLGTYGMGSPGFTGFMLYNNSKNLLIEYLVYAVYYADSYILLDNRPITGINKYNPWIPTETEEDYDNWLCNHKKFSNIVVGLEIKDVILSEDKFSLMLMKSNEEHILEFTRFDNRLSTYSSGEKRKVAYKTGKIVDYIVFQHKDAVLHL